MLLMIFLAGFTLILLLSLLMAIVRRAAPLACAGVVLWASLHTGNVWLATFVALCVFVVAAALLDHLAFSIATRPAILALEASSGAALAMLAAYAVFGSGGVEGKALALAVICSGMAALAATLTFRAPLIQV